MPIAIGTTEDEMAYSGSNDHARSWLVLAGWLVFLRRIVMLNEMVLPSILASAARQHVRGKMGVSD